LGLRRWNTFHNAYNFFIIVFKCLLASYSIKKWADFPIKVIIKVAGIFINAVYVSQSNCFRDTKVSPITSCLITCICCRHRCSNT
jgi:hypothetical protein